MQDILFIMADYLVVPFFQILSQLIWNITDVFIRPDGRYVCLHLYDCSDYLLYNNPKT